MTDLDNLIIDKEEDVPSHKQFIGEDFKWSRNLRTFGEICVLTRHDKALKGKIKNRGRLCMFVGYAKDHSGDVFRLLNLKTKKILMSRDVTWIGKTYGEYFNYKAKKMIAGEELELMPGRNDSNSDGSGDDLIIFDDDDDLLNTARTGNTQ